MSPFTFFRVPEGERSVLSAAQIKFVTLVVRRVQRAPLGPNLPTGPLVSRYWLRGTPSRAGGHSVCTARHSTVIRAAQGCRVSRWERSVGSPV